MVQLPKEDSIQPLAEIITNEYGEIVDDVPHVYREPMTLLELEYYAAVWRGIENSPHTIQIFMDRLRHFFNLEFKLKCHICGTIGYQDEISAPER